MITAKFDMPKLRRSLDRAAKNFGDTNKQAVARWGVQTCRELAVGTQVHGKGGARKKQVSAIEAGIHGTIAEVTDKQFQALKSGKVRTAKIRNRWVSVSPERLLSDAAACHEWIDRHRGAKGHAQQLDQHSIGIAPKAVLKQVTRERRERAGIAKGAWLGAGMEIAKHQRGTDKISIGKNFLGYAQKHAGRGHARAGGGGFRPFAKLSNRSKHSGSGYVLSENEKRTAIGFGLRKTINWYRMAARRALNK